MAHFPAEIVADILSQLPVEPVLRFRCVSKHWCALIDSPDFIKLHLKRSIETKSNGRLILCNSESMYSVSMMMHSLDVAVKLYYPPLTKNRCIPLISGSCDGLVLVHTKEDEGAVAIWNPSTRMYRKLPITTDDNKITTSNNNMPTAHFYGIGYDSVHDDYKVLKITQCYGGDDFNFHTQIKIYSLKMNSWTNVIADFPYLISSYGPHGGLLASGSLHWVGCEGGDITDCSIVAFDLATTTTEGYRIVPVPSLDDKEPLALAMQVSVLEGCLCISYNNQYNTCFVVWVMRDYGVQESWTKLLSFPQSYPRPFHSGFPVAFSMDGTKVLVLEDDTKLVWFDLKRKVFNPVNIRGLPKVSQAQFCCVQSLVAVGRGGESTWKKQRGIFSMSSMILKNRKRVKIVKKR